MKKMILFLSAVIVIFGLIAFLDHYQNNQKLNRNIYDEPTLNPSAVKELNDPLYQNQISLNELQKMIDDNENITVYFYSPICAHCETTTPIIVPMAEKLGINLRKLNLLEYETGWDMFEIKGTPTIINYNKGEEVSRFVGGASELEFKAFFKQIKKGNS